ncbi:MAG: ABC transporter substrate-binding protein [Lachnospiraceae bacterium]|nr:ABC transporter substrate-binding protein [Lachnospiraceae bacterium]
MTEQKNNHRLLLFIGVLILLTAVMAGIHFLSREEIPENTLKITLEGEDLLVDLDGLTLIQVEGTRINGKGEEKKVSGQGVLIRTLLEDKGIIEYSSIKVVSSDSYGAEILKEEIMLEDKAYLLYEGEELRLVVFGDENSKRSVSDVVEIIINKEETNKSEGLENDSKEITFTDDLGKEVTVKGPKRVAALLGSFADMWYLAGGEVVASADDAWDDFDLPLKEDVVNLGKTKELSLEKLFAAEPDFVLASTNTRIDREWEETLEAAKIPTAYFDVTDVEDYLRVLKICTEITGREDLYEKNGTLNQQKIAEVMEKSRQRVEKEGEKKILSLRVSPASIRAKNSKENVLGEMLADLGCINIADSNESLLENLSVEHILAQDPDYIFWVQVGDQKEEAEKHLQDFIRENPLWNQLTAVKKNKVFLMDKNLYNLKPNARWGEAYEQLEQILATGKQE